ncbi:MAG: trimethylamine methyltransferase family protein, partial [Luminiphilus sp.]
MARRSGGRQARHAQRSAPLAEHMKPVRPGELGGRYQPFSAADVDAVVATIFRILEEVGFKDATPHCIEACTAIGAELGDDGRLRMPRAVVEDVLYKARRNLTLYAQDPEYDLDLSGTRVHF